MDLRATMPTVNRRMYNSALKAMIHCTMCKKCSKNLMATVWFHDDRTGTVQIWLAVTHSRSICVWGVTGMIIFVVLAMFFLLKKCKLISLHCFDTVGCKCIRPVKNLCHLSPKILFWNKRERKLGNWLTQFQPEKSRYNGRREESPFLPM